MHRLLYFVFFLSGATGLVYQVIWVRLTGLIFGNTSFSIATVLGAFMAGLALGSWLIGRKTDSTPDPLRLYGILEIGIGISAALVPFAFQGLQSAYWAAAPALQSVSGADALVRFLSSFAVLLVPTFLMGGTLPALARAFTSRTEEVESKVRTLYALNTFGAALGSLLAALLLVPHLGTMTTTLIMAAMNVAIGVLAMRISPSVKPALAEGPEAAETADEAGAPPDDVRDRLVLLTLGVSGFSAMVYEVAWSRALTAMIGSSTYAFSIMLITFLVGIALGSSLVGRRSGPATLRRLGVFQLGIGVGAVLFLVGYVAAPYVLIALIRALFYSFPSVVATQFVLSGLLMIVATLFMGATFPVATRLYSSRMTVLGRRVGSGYSVNTVGAIAGSLLAGFVLIPAVGIERTILIGLFCNAAIAVLLLADEKHGRYAAFKWAALVLLVVTTFSMRGRVFWAPEYLDQGILIYSRQFDVRPELKIAEHYEDTDLVYFAEGNNATISVRKGENYLGLRTNGKVDASNRDDMMTQLMLGYLPMFYHPSPKDALVIGFGSGVTNTAAVAVPDVERVHCIEIEPAVVGAAPFFDEINRQVYKSPKLRLTYADARNHMNVTRERYDVIISEPSNPWIAGVASLFTYEFYERAAQVLKDDGIFAQWIQLYELDPDDLRMILAEFQRHFPEVEVWTTGAGDLAIIGARQKLNLDMGRVDRIVRSDPAIRRDFREFLKTDDPYGLLAYYLLSTKQVREFAGNALRNTDDRPLLEFHAPRMLFSDTRELNVELLYEAKPGLIPDSVNLDDPGRTYLAMIPPLLALKRNNLANQAMGVLAQAERRVDGTLHLAMARLNLESEQLDRARSSLVSADSSIPDSEPALLAWREELWGMLEEKNGSTDAAIQRYRRAVAADASRVQSVKKLAELNARNEKWAEAAGWMERFMEFQPQSLGHYWALLGDYRIADQKPDLGFDALQKALEVDPYTYWARWRLTRLFEERKQIPEAIEQLEFLMRYSFDRDADVYVKLANHYRSSGKPADARRVIAKGARIFPTNTAIFRLSREITQGTAGAPDKPEAPRPDSGS